MLLRGPWFGRSHFPFFGKGVLVTGLVWSFVFFDGRFQPQSREALMRRQWRHYVAHLSPLSCYNLTQHNASHTHIRDLCVYVPSDTSPT